MKIPVTYQQISDCLTANPNLNPFIIRKQTIEEIEKVINTPLICYVGKQNSPKSSIEEDDVTGFSDLIYSIGGDSIGVFIISNGGSPVAAERIIKLIRNKYKNITFYVSGNAYSAATMMCFSADKIVMLDQGTLGPIDPQINGTPAYAIIKSFADIEEKLKQDGPSGIAAYMPLIAKYDLTLLELCKNAQKLSEELAKEYLNNYMFKDEKDADTKTKIEEITSFFLKYEIHKTHGRSIDRYMAVSKGLKIENAENTPKLAELLLSLHNQYKFFLDRSPFVKLFENSRGINWGRSENIITIPQMPLPIPQQIFPNV